MVNVVIVKKKTSHIDEEDEEFSIRSYHILLPYFHSILVKGKKRVIMPACQGLINDRLIDWLAHHLSCHIARQAALDF